MSDGNRYFFRVSVVEDVSCVDFESRAYGNAVIGYEYYAVFKRYAVADGVVAERDYVKRERRKRRRRTRFDFGYLFGKTFGGRRGISFEERYAALGFGYPVFAIPTRGRNCRSVSRSVRIRNIYEIIFTCLYHVILVLFIHSEQHYVRNVIRIEFCKNTTVIRRGGVGHVYDISIIDYYIFIFAAIGFTVTTERGLIRFVVTVEFRKFNINVFD